MYDFSSGILNSEETKVQETSLQIQDRGVKWKFHFQIQIAVGKIEQVNSLGNNTMNCGLRGDDSSERYLYKG